MRALLLLIVAYFLCLGYSRLHPWRLLQRWVAAPPSSKKSLCRAPDSQQVLGDVNSYRRQHGLKPLRYSQTCQDAARIQAQYNADHGTFHHDNTDLPTPGDRLRKAKHHYQGAAPHWAENALRYTLSRDLKHNAGWHVFHCYHISPPHDATMRDPKATWFGTASVVDSDGVLYNAEVFAN